MKHLFLFKQKRYANLDKNGALKSVKDQFTSCWCYTILPQHNMKKTQP